MGVQYAQETINQNKNSFLNYVFNHDVRIFFDVDNSYVINKLSLVLFPFLFTGPWKKAVHELNYIKET